MKRYLTWSLIVILLITSCQPITSLPAQSPSPASTSSESTYRDPGGFFTVPVPANWAATSENGYTVLRSPDDGIQVVFMVAEGATVEEAVAQVWAAVDPSFNLPLLEIVESPSRAGVTRTVGYDYDAGAEMMVQLRAEQVEEVIYITLVRAQMAELERRFAQLDIIFSGLTLSNIVEVDLTGVMPHSLTAAQLDQFRAYIEDSLLRFDVPGAAIAVVQGDEVLFLEGFGVRERGRDEPVTPQTRLMIGSVNKTMTTMLMAQLVDEGVMAWDTPLQTILPQFAVADPEISAQMEMRHLVCACTGVPRRDLEYFFNANEMTAEKVIDSLRTFEFFTGFSEAFQYSNQMVATAGWVAAAAAGAAYGNLGNAYIELVEEKIFAPIGMDNTTFSFDEVIASGNYASPHSLSTTGARMPLPVDSERLLTGIAPTGGAWSTAEDMARYLLTELNQGVAPDGTQVVSTRNLNETWQPQVPVNATTSYGLGWFVESYKGQSLLHHGGNTSGFSTDLAFLPEADLGIVVMTNGRRTNAFTQAVRYRLLELAFDQPHEFDAQATHMETQTVEFALAPVAEAVAVDVAQVTPYLGSYSNEALGDVVLRLEGDRLILDSGEMVMEVRAHMDETGATRGYVIYSFVGPVLGLPLQLTQSEDGNLLILGQDVAQYEFTRQP
jgi:CubicO group peptidase (beta-lactamase class C family)